MTTLEAKFSAMSVHDAPCDMLKKNVNRLDVDRRFKELFKVDESIVLPVGRPYLFAGGSVLSTFYGETYAGSDIDIYIPLIKDENCIDMMKSTDDEWWRVNVTPCYPYGNFSVAKTMTINGLYVDYVFMHICVEEAMLVFGYEEMHKRMVETFDITICALAWSGNELYYPLPKENMIDKVTTHKSPAGERKQKYMKRGFKFVD